MFDNFSDSSPKKTLEESGLNYYQAEKISKDPLEGKPIGDGDRYLLQTLLGTGGMSKVYRALDTKFEDRVVAIKLMTNYSTANDNNSKRFMGEIKAISRLKHPNIIQIFDFGFTPATAPFNGAPFYVMEHLEGNTLQNLLSENKRVPLSSIFNIVNQVCAGLKESHQKGIIHRDLKPDNIFVVSGGAYGAIVKILDFGIAKSISANSSNHTKLTKHGSFIGTYRYASPEQCRGLADVDQRADIYSLGMILYEAICGSNPYNLDDKSNTSLVDWIVCHIKVTPKSLKKQPGCENIADEIENIVMKCLAKSPQARFSSVEELQNAFINSFSAKKNCNSQTVTWLGMPKVKLTAEPEQPALKAIFDKDKDLYFPASLSASSSDSKLSHTPVLVALKKSRLLIGVGVISVLVSIFAGHNYTSPKQFVSQAQGTVKEIEELQAAAEYQKCIRQAETFPKNYPEDLQAEAKTQQSNCLQQDVAKRQRQLAEDRKQAELKSDRGIDYTQLRDYLEAGKWKEADTETHRVMLEAAEGSNLNSESIRNFSCNDLKTINSLWLDYSNNHFGFSIQNKEYQKLKPQINSLGDKLGWREGYWIHYDGLGKKFDTKAPTGHLPAYVFRHFYQGEERWSIQTRIIGILDRTDSCNL